MAFPPPRVLCLSGLDPIGGAGLQADIETLVAHRIHTLSLVTALTVQDSHNVRRVVATEPALLDEQLSVLLADARPDAVKLGLLGSAEQLPVIATHLAKLAVPVICDPVLRAGGGTALVADAFPAALRAQLLPLVTVLTPNAAEARRLVPEASRLADCGAALVTAGCKRVLITGGDEPGASVVNHSHGRGMTTQRWEWPRLPEIFHGAGCTLTSAIAARLALGDSVDEAIDAGQRWTQAALARAIAVGGGRRIPGRLPA